MHQHHGHPHSHSHAGEAATPAVPASSAGPLGFALCVNAAILVLQVAGGFLAGSLALLADAAHLMADMGGLALSYTAARLAGRPATPRRSYGLYRIEILAAAVNGVVLLGISAFILFEAWHRLRAPEPIQPKIVLAIAAISIAGNALSLAKLRKSGLGGLNLRAAYLEVVADTLGSVGVFVAAAVIAATGWHVVDPILSAVLAVAIVPRTLSLLGEALHVLLEGTPPGLDHRAIEAEMRGVAGVADVHDLHVWALTSGLPILTAHVVTSQEGLCDDLLERVTGRLRESFGIDHATIQIEHADRADRERLGF